MERIAKIFWKNLWKFIGMNLFEYMAILSIKIDLGIELWQSKFIFLYKKNLSPVTYNLLLLDFK